MTSTKEHQRRLRNNSQQTDSGCWEWKLYKKNGYGVASLNGRLEQAHRASWMVFVGQIPDGKQINHKCHNRACINPDHLYIGGQKENMADMYSAGRDRHASGAENGNAVLTEKDVVEIKKLILRGIGGKEIANRYSTAPSNISAIKTGRTWRHVKV